MLESYAIRVIHERRPYAGATARHSSYTGTLQTTTAGSIIARRSSRSPPTRESSMRLTLRFLATAALPVLAACGSITDPTGPSAFPNAPLFGRGGKPRPARTPILFVHGWNSNGGVWTTMMGRFQKDGWNTGQLARFSYNTAASNATTAAIIAQKVDSIRGATGASHVALVTHSMGSLSARYYVRNLGGIGKISALVSLAGANHGTNSAVFCFQASVCEMVPGSAFLTALNEGDETPGTVQYATWWSPCDEVINPRSSTLLEGAVNTETACLTHSQLHQDSRVYAQVRDWVSQPAPATFIASAR
jgi:triacylglycerol lipase